MCFPDYITKKIEKQKRPFVFHLLFSVTFSGNSVLNTTHLFGKPLAPRKKGIVGKVGNGHSGYSNWLYLTMDVNSIGKPYIKSHQGSLKYFCDILDLDLTSAC